MVKCKLILASSSLQRIELLKTINIIPSDIVAANIDESPIKDEGCSAYVKRMSLEKAQKVFSLVNVENNNDTNLFILAADTVIVKGHTILGKPKNEEEARYFLNLISGKKHKVLTSFTVIASLNFMGKDKANYQTQNISTLRKITKLVKTEVVVKRLTNNEIDSYLQTKQWCNKSGGYAIQGYFQAFVKQINGSISSVVGLPLFEVSNTLTGLGYKNN